MPDPPGPQPPGEGARPRSSAGQGRLLEDLRRPRRRARPPRRWPAAGAAAFASKWRKLYPAAVDCLEDDFEHLITFLAFPADHWERIRHSNFIERTFGETRRRVKVIGRLPGERSCLSLIWAVLDRASRGWRGVRQSIPSIRLLNEIRRQLFQASPIDDQSVAETVIPAA